MYHNNQWLALTKERSEAWLYRIKDQDPFSQNNWYIKFINFYTYNKTDREYILPASLSKPIDMNLPINVDMWDINLYPKQSQVISKLEFDIMMWDKTWMIVSDTWTWKSYMILWLINLLKQKTVVVVPNIAIAEWLLKKFQWHCDVDIIVAKDIDKKDPDVAIVVVQSFNKIYNKLNKRYSVLLLDECHKLPKTRIAQLNNWYWKFICWLTATPQRKEFWIDWFKIMYKNIYNTWLKSLPIKIFHYTYKYDYSIKEIMEAQKWYAPDSPEIQRRLYINNRDRLVHLWWVIKSLREKWFKRFIIFTDRVDHATKIKEYLWEGYLMTWAIKNKEYFDKEEYIIIWLTQCVWEWFDLPELEVWILFMSTRWINTVEQTAWRIKRKDGKKEFWYYVDFDDRMKMWWSKQKVLWWYDRKKIYKDNWREILDIN